MNTAHFTDEPTLALSTQTAMSLSSRDLIALQLQPGDRLRSDCGTLWITVDGDLHDVLLEAGGVHKVRQGGTVKVSALHTACLVVLGRAPLQWRRAGAGTPGPFRRAAGALADALAGWSALPHRRAAGAVAH